MQTFGKRQVLSVADGSWKHKRPLLYSNRRVTKALDLGTCSRRIFLLKVLYSYVVFMGHYTAANSGNVFIYFFYFNMFFFKLFFWLPDVFYTWPSERVLSLAHFSSRQMSIASREGESLSRPVVCVSRSPVQASLKSLYLLLNYQWSVHEFWKNR